MIRPQGRPGDSRAIPGARLVTYPGMGHDLPRALWPSILDEITALAAQAPGPPALPAARGHTVIYRKPLPWPTAMPPSARARWAGRHR